MKNSVFNVAAILAMGAFPVFAIERPVSVDQTEESDLAEESVKPVQAQAEQVEGEDLVPFDFDDTPVRKIVPIIEEEEAWLGVGGSPVSKTFAAHFGIDHGLDLKVVSPDSPAEKAGFEQHDILLSADGSPLTNQADLHRVVEAKKPGESISVTFLRRGKKQEKEVVLGKRESMPAMAQRNLNQALPFQLQEFLADDDLDGMMQRMQENMDRFSQGFFGDTNDPHDKIRQMLEQAKNGAFQSTFSQQGTFKLMDSEGAVEVSAKNGVREVTVMDRAGNVLYSGPFETDEDKAAMPKNVRKRVEGMSFDFGSSVIDNNFLKNLFGE